MIKTENSGLGIQTKMGIRMLNTVGIDANSQGVLTDSAKKIPISIHTEGPTHNEHRFSNNDARIKVEENAPV
ncbi:MAG: hypothetical protein JJU12_06000 [Chlamydiales bacterium]|nr:hypothetical protein [Chlamydiales bacterium]